MASKTINAVGYARYSSDNQRQESIDAQLRAIREYCEHRNYTLIDTYEDAALTGTTDRREQFLKMIRDSRKREFEVVVVHKLDRFSRDRYDSAHYKKELRRNGVQVYSVLEHLDNSPESVIMESVLEGMAEYYSKNLAREVRKGMTENALKCMHTGGRPAFGYVVNPVTKRWEINEDEAEGVRMIFDMILEGEGYAAIMRRLNTLGYRTKRGESFGKNSLNSILRNEKYKGVYTFNRLTSKDEDGRRNSHAYKPDEEIIRIEGGVPAIITEEQFNKVQALMSARKVQSEHPKAVETYLLTGKIYCGECGSAYCGCRKFAGRNKTLHVTYRCNNRTNKRSECSNSEIRREYVERFVLNTIADIVFDEKLVIGVIERYKDYIVRTNEASIKNGERYTARLSEIDGEIANLVRVVAQTGNSSLTAGLTALEDEKREIERELRLLNEKIGMDEFPVDLLYRACDEAKKALRSGKLPEIKQVLNLYLRRVTVEREHIEVELNVVPSFTWNGLPIKLPLMRYEPEETERNITDGTKFRVLKHSLWHHNVESGYKINTDKYERY